MGPGNEANCSHSVLYPLHLHDGIVTGRKCTLFSLFDHRFFLLHNVITLSVSVSDSLNLIF